MKDGLTVGVLGGGQLGLMLGLAGIPLGLEFRFFDPDGCAVAQQVGGCINGEFEEASEYEEFFQGLDVLTYEFENVPASTVRAIAQKGIAVFPPVEALETAQDRLSEKQFFRRVGIPVPEYAAVSTRDELLAAVSSGGAVGLPAVVKTRRLGYDGKGQAVLRTVADAERAWIDITGGKPGAGLLVERLVPFDREISVIGARAIDGTIRVYDPVWNTHEGGILRRSNAPAPCSAATRAAAIGHITRLLTELKYVGMLALELFEHQGALYGNEMAPRVHNSGHWTIEGAATSQFEQHLRAICNLPLGDPTMTAPAAAMINLIGNRPDIPALLKIDGAHVHWYGKEPRPGRKVGHITTRGTESQVADRTVQIESLLARANP